jgi:hypothetical protein
MGAALWVALFACLVMIRAASGMKLAMDRQRPKLFVPKPYKGHVITARNVVPSAIEMDRHHKVGNLGRISRRSAVQTIPKSNSDPLSDEQLVSIKLDNFYFTNVSIGTPAQNLSLAVDTTLADVVVVNSSTTAATCDSTNLTLDCMGGSFDSEGSKTFNTTSVSDSPFNRTEPGGVLFKGAYYEDRLNWGNIELNNSVLAVVNNTQGKGYLGLAQNTGTENKPDGYTSFLQSLLQAGIITKLAYSMGLTNDYTDASLLLGGIDRGMYSGSLYSMPMLPVVDYIDSATEQFAFVPMTRVSVSNNYQEMNVTNGDTMIPVMLDTGNVLSYLPYSVVVNIASQLNAVYTSDLNIWVQTCDLKNLTGEINFRFMDAMVSVPISQVLVPLVDPSTNEPHYFQSGREACALTFVSSQLAGYSSLGSTILSSAYAVFDLDARQIALAQANQNKTITHDYTNITTDLSQESFITSINLTSTPTATISPYATNFDDLRSDFPFVSLSPQVESKLAAEFPSSSLANTLAFGTIIPLPTAGATGTGSTSTTATTSSRASATKNNLLIVILAMVFIASVCTI